jgi:hypothetical protein
MNADFISTTLKVRLDKDEKSSQIIYACKAVWSSVFPKSCAVLRVNSRAVAVAEVVTKAGLEFAKPCFEITFSDDMVAAVRTSWP